MLLKQHLEQAFVALWMRHGNPRIWCWQPCCSLAGSPYLRSPLCALLQINDKKLPWSLAYFPTEPVLGPTRRLVPPVGWVEVSPIISGWPSSASSMRSCWPTGVFLSLLQRKADLIS